MVLRCFSCMLPSMPKGEIVSVNADGISVGEYVSVSRDMIECLCVAVMIEFVIDVNIYTVL